MRCGRPEVGLFTCLLANTVIPISPSWRLKPTNFNKRKSNLLEEMKQFLFLEVAVHFIQRVFRYTNVDKIFLKTID